MTTAASEDHAGTPVPRTPKIVLLGLVVLFLLAISVPCAWLYMEIVNFRDPGARSEVKQGTETSRGGR